MRFVEMIDAREGAKLKIFYKKLLDQVPDLIFKMIWLEDDLYSVVFASESIIEIYELSVEESKKDTEKILTERVLPDDLPLIFDALEVSKKTLTPWDIEYRVQLPKKGLRWLKLNARPELQKDGTIHYYGRISDITDHKNHELQMRLAKERYEYALSAANEGLWDWNMKDNTVYFSAQTMKILGREEKEAVLTQKFWMSRIHPEDMKTREIAKKKGLLEGEEPYESVYRVRTDDGGYRWLLSRGKTVEFDDEGNPTRAIGVHKDITSLKQKEMELAKTINIIGDQNNRLSNFAHIVSHNLRSHAGNLKMLLDLFKTADESEKEEMLEHLEGISDGLWVTIGHLKELVEIQSEIKTVRERLNLRHYLKNILNILQHEIKKNGVTIEVNIPLDTTVNYNAAYLESVLLNFTTNAIKYSSPDRPLMLTYDFEMIKGQKVLSVTDNGLGIDLKKHKKSLFGMYKTFHKHNNARGIGLFITKNQIEAMGGKIEVFSKVNEGTTFKIYFNDED